jgi:hypothetical protein
VEKYYSISEHNMIDTRAKHFEVLHKFMEYQSIEPYVLSRERGDALTYKTASRMWIVLCYKKVTNINWIDRKKIQGRYYEEIISKS